MQGGKVLLVEDDKCVIVGLRRTLRSLEQELDWLQGKELVVAGSISEAEQVLARPEEPFAAIILDLMLPDANIELDGLKRLIDVVPDIPIVVYSVAITPEIRAQAIEIGAANVVTKTYDYRDIWRRVVSSVDLHRVRRECAFLLSFGESAIEAR